MRSMVEGACDASPLRLAALATSPARGVGTPKAVAVNLAVPSLRCGSSWRRDLRQQRIDHRFGDKPEAGGAPFGLCHQENHRENADHGNPQQLRRQAVAATPADHAADHVSRHAGHQPEGHQRPHRPRDIRQERLAHARTFSGAAPAKRARGPSASSIRKASFHFAMRSERAKEPTFS